MHLKSFTFGPFAENTFILSDNTSECVIIDPGMYNSSEQSMLDSYISENELKPVALINTHCHIDHVFGVYHVVDKYKIPFYIHPTEQPTLDWAPSAAMMYGLNLDTVPKPSDHFDLQKGFHFGDTDLEIRFTPGHSPGSVVFIHHDSRIVIGGDVIFRESIGRTDLPGGDFDTLEASIKNEIYTLSDEYLIYSGHGPSTTVGHERSNNPFVRG